MPANLPQQPTPEVAVPLHAVEGHGLSESASRIRAVDPGGAWVVAVIAAVGILPAFLTLRTVVHPYKLVATSANPTPLGYTWSLSLWIVPVVAIALWLHASPKYNLPQRTFWITVLSLSGLGVVLDLAFGNAFFTFPNKGAVLGYYVWGYDLHSGQWVKNIPIEEFGFYLFGIAAALLLYIWSDIYWFGRYVTPGDLLLERRAIRPKIQLHWPSALTGVALLVAAILYKRSTGQPGFPGYFAFLLAVAFIPGTLLLGSVSPFINWRAYSFVALAMFTISMLWEATAAVPYEWWGYRPEMMIGIFINAWAGVPIEEPFLWMLVTFTTVIVFEAVHLLVVARMPAPTGEDKAS
jgi:hypothetical protein